MGYLNEFPHTKNWDSDLRQILEMFAECKELPTSFEELKEFVDKYFTNLDVQNEINSKLDAMYHSGELESMLQLLKYKYVTPQMFGGVGDGIADDGESIQKAIDYLVHNNGGTLFFPNGIYKCVNRTFSIDTELISLVGESKSTIYSEGLSNGVFITLLSKLDMNLYSCARTPIRNITIKGSYFTNNPLNSSGVIGLSWGEKGEGSLYTVVPCHASLENVIITKFAIGFLLNTSYKSVAFNLSIIACDIGLWVGTGTNVPWHCHNIYIECCGKAIVHNGGDFSAIHFIGGAIEYNRVNYFGKSKVVFDNVKFEYDMGSCCDNNLNMLTPFEGLNSYSTQLCFNNCHFTVIDNYMTNVTPWIGNPIKSTAFPEYVFKVNASSTSTNCAFVMTNCQYTASAKQKPASGELISCNKGIQLHAFDLQKEYGYVISKDENLLFDNQLNISPNVKTYIPLIGDKSMCMCRLKPDVDCTLMGILARVNADGSLKETIINSFELIAGIDNYAVFPIKKGYEKVRLYFDKVGTLSNSIVNLV